MAVFHVGKVKYDEYKLKKSLAYRSKFPHKTYRGPQECEAK